MPVDPERWKKYRPKQDKLGGDKEEKMGKKNFSEEFEAFLISRSSSGGSGYAKALSWNFLTPAYRVFLPYFQV